MPQLSAFRYPVPQDPRKILVTTGDQFEQMMRYLQAHPVRIFDHETSGLAWWQHSESCGLGLGCIDGRGPTPMSWYVPYRHNTGEPQLDLETIRPAFKNLFADSYATWIAHNFQFDEHMNRKEGWYIAGKRYCTMMAARLMDENRPVALKYRAENDLGRIDAKEWEGKLNAEIARLCKQRGMGKKAYLALKGYSEVPIDLAGFYGCHDVDFAGSLYQLYEAWGLSSHFARVWNTEMELLEVLCDMEEWGMPIDQEYLGRLGETLGVRMKQLEDEAARLLGSHVFDMGTDERVREFLYKTLRLPWIKYTEKGSKLSVDSEVLTHFKDVHPLIPLIMEYREASKIKSTWTDSIIDKLDAYGILHGQLNSGGTNTGRMSSKGPNLQNFAHDSDDRAMAHSGKKIEDGGIDPWSIRRAFTMRPGMERGSFDYSQIELRVIAYYSRDPVMVETFQSGGDIHRRTQKEIGAMIGDGSPIPRRPAKVVNFGISYGLTEKGLARQGGISQENADLFYGIFRQRYSRVFKYQEWFWYNTRFHGCQFTNFYGRPRRVPDLMAHEAWKCRRAQRQAFATLIQGSAAEVMKETLVRLHKWIKASGCGARLASVVHDDAWIDFPAGTIQRWIPEVKSIMENYPVLDPIPVVVDTQYSPANTTWCDKQDLNVAIRG